MSQAFRILKQLLHLFAKQLARLRVGPASRTSEDQLDYHTISITTR